jgi:GNAT superfamily N-acetyltransferase
MTPRPAVERAYRADVDGLSHLIADAFFDLAPSRWLIGDPVVRRQVFPGYFRLHVEQAVVDGVVYTTVDRDAVALWLRAGAPRQENYDERLAALTGSALPRFQGFDAMLGRHQPTGSGHEHLAILAVRPVRQGRGAGTALLLARHTVLDRAGTPAYLEASSPRARDLYLRHGYAPRPGAPFRLPDDGPPMWPMWREPHRPGLGGGGGDGGLGGGGKNVSGRRDDAE